MTDVTRPGGYGLSFTLDALDRSRSKGTARLVLFKLADETNHDGWTQVSLDTLRFANCSPTDADDAVDELVALGEVIRHNDQLRIV